MKNHKSLIKENLYKSFKFTFEQELLDEIIEIGTYKKIAKGQMFVDIGDEMTHIPLIVKGVIKVIREDNNNDEILLYFLESGGTCAISFANCINIKQSIFRGIAEIDTECILIPVNSIEGWLVKYRTWREFIIDSYHERLTEMVEAIETVAFLNLDDRLTKYLLNEVKILQKKELQITHQEIASDLNTSRVVISRILKKLERKGKIELGRNVITIINL